MREGKVTSDQRTPYRQEGMSGLSLHLQSKSDMGCTLQHCESECDGRT